MEAVVLGKVQTMLANEARLPDKLIRGPLVGLIMFSVCLSDSDVVRRGDTCGGVRSRICRTRQERSAWPFNMLGWPCAQASGRHCHCPSPVHCQCSFYDFLLVAHAVLIAEALLIRARVRTITEGGLCRSGTGNRVSRWAYWRGGVSLLLCFGAFGRRL